MAISDFLGSLISRERRAGRRPQRRQFLNSVEVCEERLLLSAAPVAGLPFVGTTPTTTGTTGQTNPLTSLPRLNSLSGAPVTVFLDFDGHVESNSSWTRQINNNNDIITPVYDIDRDQTTFSDEELRRIEEIWYRVAEDFSPFNVNVTTVDPGTYNDFETVLVAIGGPGTWLGAAAGGVAWLNSFNNNLSNTVYAFTDNLGNGFAKYTAAAISHEVGHALGLEHHSVYDTNGNKTAEYNPGTPALGPIMGAPYNSDRIIWNDGPSSSGANVFQDDLAVMVGAQNQTFTYRVDDHGNNRATPTVLNSAVADVSASGIIERNSDVDYFAFDTASGVISFSAEGLDLRKIFPSGTNNAGTNLDIVLTLYDQAGNTVATSNPTNTLNASLTANVTAGTYFIAVGKTAEYGALGQYSLQGTIVPQAAAPTLIGPTGLQTSPSVTFLWTPTLRAARYELEVTDRATGDVVFNDANIRAVAITPSFQFPQADYTARVRAIQTDGVISEWSNIVSFTVDLPAPTRPVITNPSVDVTTESFPQFAWTANNATSFTLEVEQQNSNGTWSRVINRTNHDNLSYTHFNPLPEASYRARVRAFNAIGEVSAWSEYENFAIDVPTPERPLIQSFEGTVETSKPRIDWEPVQFAYQYDLWVNDLSRGVSQVIRISEIEGQSHYDPIAPLQQGSYRAWVRARNGAGEFSAWSAPETFLVDVLAPSRPTMTAPGLNTNGQVDTAKPTFQWDPAERAVSYELWVNHDTTGTARIIHETSVTALLFAPEDPLPQGDFRAWVRGFNSAGEGGPWSAPLRFSIDVPTPSQPRIVGPAPGPAGTVRDATPTISWLVQDPGTVYDLWVNDVTLGKSQVIRVQDLDTTSFTVPDAQILAEHTYTAWVRAGNDVGEFSRWSDPFTFTIDVPNATTPVIFGPVGTVTQSRPTFTWQHTPGNTKYQIFVRDLERRENVVLDVENFNIDGANQTAAFTSNIDFATGTYRFWIRAFNSQGTASSWSRDQSFRISVQVTPEQDSDADPNSVAEQLLLTSLDQPQQVAPTDVPAAARETVVAERQSQHQQATQDSNFAAEAGVTTVTDADLHDTVAAVMAELADPAGDLALHLEPENAPKA